MSWSKPEFQEITLNMEVTAYVNTDESQPWQEEQPERLESLSAPLASLELQIEYVPQSTGF